MRYGVVPMKTFLHEIFFQRKFHYAKISGFTVCQHFGKVTDYEKRDISHCTCVHTCACLHVCVRLCICTHVVCTCVHVFKNIHVCACDSEYVCTQDKQSACHLQLLTFQQCAYEDVISPTTCVCTCVHICVCVLCV